MWRSLFIALGVMAIILGFECLVIDSASVYSTSDTSARSFINPIGSPSASTHEWRPKEWFPWAFLSAGGITILYAFTLPKRWYGAPAGG